MLEQSVLTLANGLIVIKLERIIEQIKCIKNIDIFFNHDLSLFSTMRLKSEGDLFVVKSIDSLKLLLKIFYKADLNFIILGLGANTLLPEKGSVSYIKLKLPFDKSCLNIAKEGYELPASVTLSVLSSHASKYSLSGWEVFTGIPASLGGAVFMNAGTKLGEIGNLITEVKIITKKGEEKIIKIKPEHFGYRCNHFCSEGDFIVSVKMKHNGVDKKIPSIIKDYLKLRNNSQPLKEFTCGCVFKNTKNAPAGKMIDIMGLKGLRVGGVRVSTQHSNFMENTGGGSKTDVLKLVAIIESEILLNYGIHINTEVTYA